MLPAVCFIDLKMAAILISFVLCKIIQAFHISEAEWLGKFYYLFYVYCYKIYQRKLLRIFKSQFKFILFYKCMELIIQPLALVLYLYTWSENVSLASSFLHPSVTLKLSISLLMALFTINFLQETTIIMSNTYAYSLSPRMQIEASFPLLIFNFPLAKNSPLFTTQIVIIEVALGPRL